MTCLPMSVPRPAKYFNKTVSWHYLIAEAHDGYKSVFSWAEVDPTFTDRKVYVVTSGTGSCYRLRTAHTP